MLTFDYAYYNPQRQAPHKLLAFGDGLSVSASLDGEKVGSVVAREILFHRPRCYLMWSAMVRVDHRREGIGTALYLELAHNLPGLIIPDRMHSNAAEGLWMALHRWGHTIHVQGPLGWTLALP